MIKVRLVTFYEAPSCWDRFESDADEDVELDVQLNEYVGSNIGQIDSPGFEVEDFEIPDNLNMGENKQLVMDICNGKSFSTWINNGVDFHNEYYQNWVYFKNKDNEWQEF